MSAGLTGDLVPRLTAHGTVQPATCRPTRRPADRATIAGRGVDNLPQPIGLARAPSQSGSHAGESVILERGRCRATHSAARGWLITTSYTSASTPAASFEPNDGVVGRIGGRQQGMAPPRRHRRDLQPACPRRRAMALATAFLNRAPQAVDEAHGRDRRRALLVLSDLPKMG